METFFSWDSLSICGVDSVPPIRGESLASIARAFGVSATTVKLWLDGKRNPSRMALVLGGLLARGDAGAWPMDDLLNL